MPQNYWIRVERGQKHPTAGYIGKDGPDPGGVTILVDGDLKPGHVTRVLTQLANLVAVNHVGKLIRRTPAAPAQEAESKPKPKPKPKLGKLGE